MEKIWNAIDLAAKHHKKQVREGRLPLPYIVHPMAVLSLLGIWDVNNEAMSCAAICHDLLEDTACTEEEMKGSIGDLATAIVKELTFIPPTKVSKGEAAEAKKEYIKTFQSKSIQSLVIKLADRICNTCDFLANSNTRDYAPKYWNKAGKLFDAFYDRQEEFRQNFGVRAFDIIELNLISMQNRLSRVVFPFFDDK